MTPTTESMIYTELNDRDESCDMGRENTQTMKYQHIINFLIENLEVSVKNDSIILWEG